MYRLHLVSIQIVFSEAEAQGLSDRNQDWSGFQSLNSDIINVKIVFSNAVLWYGQLFTEKLMIIYTKCRDSCSVRKALGKLCIVRANSAIL